MTETTRDVLPRIWMNVTTSAEWSRPPVGIVRVEIELCRELKALYGDRFSTCVFKDGTFLRQEDVRKEEFWPETLLDFPSLTSLDGASDAAFTDEAEAPVTDVEAAPQSDPEVKFHYGDTLLTVGLDWEWDKHGFTNRLADLKKQRGVNVVSCCYDLIPILFPQYCVGDVANRFKSYFSKLTWSSSLMLCISKQTQSDYRDLVSNLGLPEIPSVVFPLGNNLPEHGYSTSDQVKEIVEKPYILFVSTIERRKNHEVLYRAYHLLCRAGYRDILPKLVFVGMPGWGVGDLLKDIELDPQTQDLIIQLNHVNDLELELLYENCVLFAYPSLYEGWGLPVAEALSYGRPVFASDCGSIPEVGGDLVDYIDPWSPAAWADAILHAVQNPEEIKQKAEHIAAQYQPRTWSAAAEVVKNAIEDLASQPCPPIRFEPGYDLSTHCGVPYGGTLASTGDGGVLSFGPYMSLPKGKFSIALDISTLEGSGGNFYVKVVCNKGHFIFVEKSVELPNHQLDNFDISMDFEIEQSIVDFEIVTIIQDGVRVKMNSVVVTRVSE